MPAATPEHLKKLEPYLAGGVADERGEIEMHCPIHGDNKRSASVNPAKGVWYCHAGCGGGSIRHLCAADDAWKPVPAASKRRASLIRRAAENPFNDGDVDRWRWRLEEDRKAIDELWNNKGITMDTAVRAHIGYNGRHFKLPVYSIDRQVLNVRTYDMHPGGGRRKIWSVKGMGQARLYPLQPISKTGATEKVLLCEGEWDTLLALQAGYCAVTRTDGAGKPWHEEWDSYFAGKRVILVPDRDNTGVESAVATAERLRDVAESVKFINLPNVKKGYDLSDHLLGQSKPHWLALGVLMADAEKTARSYK